MIDYLTDLPARMKGLPLDKLGHPVPWFVMYVKGEPDFRIMDAGRLIQAVRQSLCWICGQPLELAKGTFVIGPMCAVNRVSSEPPSHSDCAIYSATHCPFLITPRRKRRLKDLPDDAASAGIMIERNPGVTLVWTSKKWWPFSVPNGVLFNIGDPIRLQWYHEGRPATRLEVEEAIETGLPTLHEAAQAQGDEAVAELRQRVKQARAMVVISVNA